MDLPPQQQVDSFDDLPDQQPQQQVDSFDDLPDQQPQQLDDSCDDLSDQQTMDMRQPQQQVDSFDDLPDQQPQQQFDSFDDLPDPQQQQLDDSCDDLSDQQTMDMRQQQQLVDSFDDLPDQQPQQQVDSFDDLPDQQPQQQVDSFDDLPDPQQQQLDESCDDLSDQQTMDMRQPQQQVDSFDDLSDQLAMDPQQQQVDDSCDDLSDRQTMDMRQQQQLDDSCDVQSVDSDDSDIKIIDNDVKPFSGNMFFKKRYSTANTPLFAAKNAMPFILNKILFSRKGSIEKTTEKLLQGAKTALAKYMESGKYGIYVNFVDVPSEDSFGSEFDKIYTHAAIVETLNANGYSLTEVKMLTDLNYLMTTNVTIIVYGTTNSSFHIDDYSIRTIRHVKECNHVVLIKNKVMHCIFLKNTGQLGMIAKKYMNVAHNKGWKKTRGNSYLDIIKAAFVVQKK
jgi:hypothetical protein